MEKVRQPKVSTLDPKWLVIGLFLIFFLLIGGQSAKLTCKHTRQAGSVNCVRVKSLMWIIPMGTFSIGDVRGAQLGESYDDETGETYRVELITGKGIIPLSSVYTSGYSTKRDVADQINAYILDSANEPLDVTEPGLLSLENILCAAIWLPISYAINLIWKSIKSPAILERKR